MKIMLEKHVKTAIILSILLLCVPITASAFRNSLGMDMLPIKGGSFVMGSEKGRGGEDEMPAHEVTLGPFYISDTEVTIAQWKVFCGSSGTSWNKWNDIAAYSPADIYPVCFVSWEDAKEFCNWLSAKEGRTYRLPTEAEWEYAARGGLQGMSFPWGDQEPDGTQCNFADRLEFEKEKDIWADQNIADGYAYCAPARAYAPNGFGLYNMAGNLWEWCEDWYCATYYRESPSKDPAGPSSGRLRSVRGGAWCFHPDMLRVSNRYGADPTLRSGFTGFRIVAMEE